MATANVYKLAVESMTGGTGQSTWSGNNDCQCFTSNLEHKAEPITTGWYCLGSLSSCSENATGHYLDGGLHTPL